MTENEIIDILEAHFEFLKANWKPYPDEKVLDALRESIENVREIQQYRSIGTVEECRAAMEKQKAEKPNIWGDGYDENGNMIYDMYSCPNCGKSYEIDYEEYNYCPECGQAIDWGDNH